MIAVWSPRAVGGDVQGAVLEPVDRDIVIGVAGVLDLGIGLDPVEPLAVLAPECLRVVDRRLVHLVIFGVVDQCVCRHGGRHGVHLYFAHPVLPISYRVDES
jgi:hypothetical protein